MNSIHDDVILTNIIPYLDGPSLASLTSVSSNLHNLITSDTNHLWSHMCFATWPSLNNPRIRHVISTFKPDGPRSFFSQAHGASQHDLINRGERRHRLKVREFISAVDIRFKDNLIFSETVVTVDTDTSWFGCAPFRVDMLNVDQKAAEEVSRLTKVKHPKTDNECGALLHDLTLSWIIVDSVNGTTVNLSSDQPVSVERHWLTGEVLVQFCTVLAGGGEHELVKCGIKVTLGGSEGSEMMMEVREVSLVMKDMDGKHLNGEGSLVNLEWALQGNKIRGRYEEFLEKKRERKEREVRREQRLDLCCVTFGVTLVLSSFLLFVVYW